MKRATTTIAALLGCLACSTCLAVWAISDKGAWPKSWPKELEPLRRQSRSLVGGRPQETLHQIPFTSRKAFEAAWPHILKVKGKGVPIILFPTSMGFEAGVVVRNADKQAAPINQKSKLNPNERGAWPTYLELVVDGKIVDLNRIRIPAGTPIIDKRFDEKSK